MKLGLPNERKIRFQMTKWEPQSPHTARLKTENPTIENLVLVPEPVAFKPSSFSRIQGKNRTYCDNRHRPKTQQLRQLWQRHFQSRYLIEHVKSDPEYSGWPRVRNLARTNDGLPPGQAERNESAAGEKCSDTTISEKPYSNLVSHSWPESIL